MQTARKLTCVSSTVTSTEVRNKLSRILADIDRTGESITITRRGRPIARLVPVTTVVRKFGQLPGLLVPDDFDEPLPGAELAGWNGVTNA